MQGTRLPLEARDVRPFVEGARGVPAEGAAIGEGSKAVGPASGVVGVPRLVVGVPPRACPSRLPAGQDG